MTAAAPGGGPFDVLKREGGPDEGWPWVSPDDRVAVSISHSGEWAVAVAAAGPTLGVDLESSLLSPEPSFYEEAFAPGELSAWRLPAELASLRTPLAWAAKEAALKVWGVGLRAPLGAVGLFMESLQPGAFGWELEARLEVYRDFPRLGPAPSQLRGVLATVDASVFVLLEARAPAKESDWLLFK